MTIGPSVYNPDHNAPIHLLIGAQQFHGGKAARSYCKLAREAARAAEVMDEMAVNEVLKKWRGE